MIKLDQVIVVEGKYDKIKLSSFLDATIIVTDGFKIYKDKKKINMIRNLARKFGVIILTDSDVAGFKIRNFISSFLSQEKIINVYIPQIKGKEKRKVKPSQENILGVEGVDKEIILNCLKLAGVFKTNLKEINNDKIITKLLLYEDGLIGSENSEKKRLLLKNKLDLPTYISTKELINILNRLLTVEEYRKIIKDFK